MSEKYYFITVSENTHDGIYTFNVFFCGSISEYYKEFRNDKRSIVILFYKEISKYEYLIFVELNDPEAKK